MPVNTLHKSQLNLGGQYFDIIDYTTNASMRHIQCYHFPLKLMLHIFVVTLSPDASTFLDFEIKRYTPPAKGQGKTKLVSSHYKNNHWSERVRVYRPDAHQDIFELKLPTLHVLVNAVWEKSGDHRRILRLLKRLRENTLTLDLSNFVLRLPLSHIQVTPASDILNSRKAAA
jgi:hypothetical protein